MNSLSFQRRIYPFCRKIVLTMNGRRLLKKQKRLHFLNSQAFQRIHPSLSKSIMSSLFCVFLFLVQRKEDSRSSVLPCNCRSCMMRRLESIGRHTWGLWLSDIKEHSCTLSLGKVLPLTMLPFTRRVLKSFFGCIFTGLLKQTYYTIYILSA